jgi:phosphate transport system permease protein
MSSESRTSTPDLTRENSTQAVRERTYHALFLTCAILSVATTLAIIITLVIPSLTFFQQYGVADFIFGTDWSVIAPMEFGVLPLVYGTLIVTLGSAAIALPIGLLTAIYLSEYASDRMHSILKPMLEILAGVPTVVYGYFALVYITPFLRQTLFPTISTFNALSASIVVGIMIIPMVASISEDAMSAVPDSLRQAGYGLGATKFKVSTSIVVPAAISGIASSFILALSRAIGETMAVTVAFGTNARLPPVRTETLFGIPIPYVNPGDVFLNPGTTMTAQMVNTITGDIGGGSLSYNSVFAIGLLLFVITLGMNVVSNLIAQRYREEY